MFAAFASIMEREFDTLVITYPSNTPLTYTALELLVLESLPTDRPFVLLGESFSGPIAISLSARQLPRQAGLVLCSTFGSVPTIYLRAKHDWVVPGTASALVSSMHRDTRIIEIEAPHFLLQVAPEEVARHIRGFLKTLDGT
ncbi:alpha/beta fold hydrolase [Pseudomonas sp. ANT_J28]|uniref:alpha/beta fold hydrolase n=1 Tax=Pseudomonas sp. ANT_J28 TaxID=2597352 RepID=UPI002113A5A0|nr:alpha/beta hydrolase [Pseudomonas sp. ANT_J28]